LNVKTAHINWSFCCVRRHRKFSAVHSIYVYISDIRQTVRYRTPVFIQAFPWHLHITITYNLLHLRLWYADVVTVLRCFKVEDLMLKRHISIGVFVVYIDTGSPVLYIPYVIWWTKITKFWRNGNDSKQRFIWHLNLIIKLFYLYQRLQCRDKYFFKIKFVFFLYLLLSASWSKICLCFVHWFIFCSNWESK
jgi:hypothetical protein